MPTSHRRTSLLLLTTLTGFIAAPVLYAAGMMHQLTFGEAAAITLGATGIALLTYCLRALPTKLGSFCIIAALSICVLIRLTYLGLIQFSGAGFNAEFFMHLSTESVSAAWRMYGWKLAVVSAFIIGYLVTSNKVALKLPRPNLALVAVLACTGIFTSLVYRSQLPEFQLATASRTLLTPTEIPGYAELQQRWQNSTLVETNLTAKAELKTELPTKPRNLILVYLESIGSPIINHPDWPGLMPHLNKLVENHSIADTVYASSFITIEGIVNTQCGTLFPFDRGSDSLANGHNLGSNLPCLGDVLAHAGYQNRYLGGASLDFAGKGRFLQSHGFNNPMGIRYWREQGIRQRPGTWGISDPDIFAQALRQYQQLQKTDQPFNITLLTIGTHIPGFYYQECEHYSGSDDPFLDGLHCTDQLLHTFLEQLKAQNAFDNTTVVITADHNVFNSPNMQNLFGSATTDHRVPLVVLGSEQRPSTHSGAGYDLAPTVLDLLSVKHNAVFPLGRSLLQPNTRPAYALTRYTEIYDEKARGNGSRQCQSDQPSGAHVNTIPSACQRNDLFSLLRRQIESQSLVAATLSCENDKPLTVQFPAGKKAPLQISLQNRDISHYFSQQGRRIKDSAGLYLMWFDATGRLESTEFSGAAHAAKEFKALAQSDITRRWVAVWVAPQEADTHQVPKWLTLDPDVNGVALGERQADNTVAWKAYAVPSSQQHWSLTRKLCQGAPQKMEHE